MIVLDDIRLLGYVVDVDERSNTVAVRGFGLACMYRLDDASALAAIADPSAHAERAFQFSRPDAAAARAKLEQAGYSVTRDTPTVDVFSVAQATQSASPPPTTATVSLSPIDGATPDDLIKLAGQV